MCFLLKYVTECGIYFCRSCKFMRRVAAVRTQPLIKADFFIKPLGPGKENGTWCLCHCALFIGLVAAVSILACIAAHFSINTTSRDWETKTRGEEE